MIFKMYECDFGIKFDGVAYDFPHVNEVTIEDPENTKLVRGSNAGNKTGLVYKEGLKEPKRMIVTIMGMSPELKAVLDQVYENKSRVDAFAISRDDGSSKMAKNSVLSQQPQQLTLNDTPDSMNVTLTFETFDMTEVHKS